MKVYTDDGHYTIAATAILVTALKQIVDPRNWRSGFRAGVRSCKRCTAVGGSYPGYGPISHFSDCPVDIAEKALALLRPEPARVPMTVDLYPDGKPEPEPRYKMAGKLGPWARRWAKGERYLARGKGSKRVYRRIMAVDFDHLVDFSAIPLWLEGNLTTTLCSCNYNTYTKEPAQVGY